MGWYSTHRIVDFCLNRSMKNQINMDEGSTYPSILFSPKVGGKVPPMKLLLIKKAFSFLHSPSSGGKVPCSQSPWISTYVISVRYPNSFGNSP